MSACWVVGGKGDKERDGNIGPELIISEGVGRCGGSGEWIYIADDGREGEGII